MQDDSGLKDVDDNAMVEFNLQACIPPMRIFGDGGADLVDLDEQWQCIANHVGPNLRNNLGFFVGPRCPGWGPIYVSQSLSVSK